MRWVIWGCDVHGTFWEFFQGKQSKLFATFFLFVCLSAVSPRPPFPELKQKLLREQSFGPNIRQCKWKEGSTAPPHSSLFGGMPEGLCCRKSGLHGNQDLGVAHGKMGRLDGRLAKLARYHQGMLALCPARRIGVGDVYWVGIHIHTCKRHVCWYMPFLPGKKKWYR